MIDPINSNYSILQESLVDKSKENENISFAQMLKENLQTVNNLQIESDQITEDFMLGKIDNIHDVTIAAEKAKFALDLTLAVQNKVVDAYNELMRMQV